VAALLSGQADLVSDIPPTRREDQVQQHRARGDQHAGRLRHHGEDDQLPDARPWQDVRVRKAINYAIDMDTIIKTVLEGYGQVLGVPLEKEAFGFNPSIKWYGYDPERAKTLLREAGHPNGFEMTLHAPNRRYMNDIEVMQAMAQMLTKVGIRAKVESGSRASTRQVAQARAAAAYLVAWGGAGVFDGDLLTSSLNSKSALPSSRTRPSTRCWRTRRPPTTPSAARPSTSRRRSSSTRGAHHQGLPAGHIFG